MIVPVTLNPPEKALVRLVNLERATRGLHSLRAARGLTKVAREHSSDLMRHFRLDHSSSDGTPFNRRLAGAGRFRATGEVVAWTSDRNHATALEFVRMWMRSPPHRAALLDPRFRVLGVGRARGPRGTWVTADLAAR
jgi:uncharacterized protein YkwD